MLKEFKFLNVQILRFVQLSWSLSSLSVLKGLFLSKIQGAFNYNNGFNVIGYLQQRKQSKIIYMTEKARKQVSKNRPMHAQTKVKS